MLALKEGALRPTMILGFVGVSPVRSTIFGRVEAVGDGRRRAWLGEAERLGRKAA